MLAHDTLNCGNTPQVCSRPLSGPQLNNHTSLLKVPFRAPASETISASHAYRICQLTNGRAGWPAEICIKEGGPGYGHSLTLAPGRYISRRKKLSAQAARRLTPKGVSCRHQEGTSDAWPTSAAKDPTGRSPHTAKLLQTHLQSTQHPGYRAAFRFSSQPTRLPPNIATSVTRCASSDVQ
jgi:hypothetical protein